MQQLVEHSPGIEILSTGGTAQKLRDAGLTVKDVAEYTGAQECLNGRVKTLHPKIHGGILAVRGNAEHEAQMKEQGMEFIDLVCINLYPFTQTVSSGAVFEQCIENIDIGGPSMLRSTAKNHAFTTVVTNPAQYNAVIDCLKNNKGTTLALRRQLAAAAFSTSAAYDCAIASYMSDQLKGNAVSETGLSLSPAPVLRVYQPERTLKYGCNPHQIPAQMLSHQDKSKLPFSVVSGTPGYINLLDAVNAWQLVRELHQATGLASAASFKHVSPAGAAVAVPLSDVERQGMLKTETNEFC